LKYLKIDKVGPDTYFPSRKMINEKTYKYKCKSFANNLFMGGRLIYLVENLNSEIHSKMAWTWGGIIWPLEIT
jgi:hypothetical protein